MQRFNAAAEVFVFPTLGDPSALVVDEVMACSLPVISTSAAGERHARVEETMNGCIVPSEDCLTLADHMLWFVNNPELRERMGKVLAAKIAGDTPKQWAEEFESIVNELL